MSKQSISVPLMVTFFLLTLLGNSSSTATPSALPLGLNGHEQGDSSLPGEVIAYSLQLPSAGILAVEVMTSGPATEPDLRLLAEDGSPWVLLDRGINRWNLAALSAGTLHLEISAQDTRQALGSYRVVSRFAAAEITRSDCEMAGGDTGPGGEGGWSAERFSILPDFTMTKLEEVDPNPGGLQGGPVGPWVEVLRRSSMVGVSQGLAAESLGTKLEEVGPQPGKLQVEPGIQLDSTWLRDRFSNREGHPCESLTRRADVTASLDSSVLDTPGGGLGSMTKLEEVDPNPGGLEAGPGTPWGLLNTVEASRPLVGLEEIGRFEGAGETDFVRADVQLGGLLGLCGRGEDDHEDSFACATALQLGQWMEGRFDLGQGVDDVDIFTFTLDHYSAMDIATGGFGKGVSLYDDEGQRLALDSWTSGARWQRTLSPGRYFIVLEGGPGADQSYQLRAMLR